MQQKFYIWYGDFCEYINKICKDERVSKIDTIICIGRGGYVPGTYISHKLGVDKVYTIVTKSYTDDNKQGELKLIQAPNLNDDDQRILIVDDIVDSGNTYKAIKKWFSIVYPTKDLIFASIAYKEKSTFSDVVYGLVVPENDWIVFPWESWP